MSKKLIRAFVSVLVLAFCAAFVVSCSGGKYETEEVTETLPLDGEVAESLCDMVRMLTVNSPVIPEFDSIGEAMDECRDSVLYYMLTKNYGKYTGDLTRLDSAAEEYPKMKITHIIPAREFESTVYASFGGKKKISHESGRVFVYLDKIAAYTAVTMIDTDSVEINVTDLVETKSTYRMRFRCEAGGVKSGEYRAIFIKRDDGTTYFYSVEEME